MMRVITVTVATLLLVACAETEQVSSENRHVPDVAPHQGAKNTYVVKGWTPGDKVSWEKQLRERGQYQNEYVKVN